MILLDRHIVRTYIDSDSSDLSCESRKTLVGSLDLLHKSRKS